jgi:hypothetical protein
MAEKETPKESKRTVSVELTEPRIAKLQQIMKLEHRSMANVLELVINNWLDKVEVGQFGIHGGFRP